MPYYGYRYYSPELGKWISTDPLGERGGMNLYGFLGNNPVARVDYLGWRDYILGYEDPATPADSGSGGWNSDPHPIGGAFIRLQLQAAGVAFSLWRDANAHLQHYLGNSGSRYTIDLQRMIDEVPSAKQEFNNELALAMQFAETLSAPAEITSKLPSEDSYNGQSENANWFYAVGGYKAWGKANVTCATGQYFQMDFEYKFNDYYNWNNGGWVTVGPVTITDEFMGSLHRMGVAKEFQMVGKVRKWVVWEKGSTPTVLDIPSRGRR